MRKLLIRFMAALLTFITGVAAVSVIPLLQRQFGNRNRLSSELPCRDGLVSVESQPEAPLRISIKDASCANPRMTTVHFVVENVSAQPIREYQIRSIETYERFTSDGSGVTHTGPDLPSDQTRDGFLGGGSVNNGKLLSYKLVVWDVTFTDGTKWSRIPSSGY